MRPAALCLLAFAASVAVPFDQDLYRRAAAAFQAGEWETAANGFEALVEASPDWAPGRVILGQTYLLLGRPDEGRRQFEAAQAVDPSTDLFTAYAAVGQELIKRERADEAVTVLDAALDLAPEDRATGIALQLADVCLRTGLDAKARAVLERIPETSSEVAYRLALACRRLDDYDCAVEQLRSVQRSGADPGRGKLPEYLAQWSYARALLPANADRRDALLVEALEAARSWYAGAPDDAGARRYLGETLLALDRADEVVATFRPIADRDRTDCGAALLTARGANARGDGALGERYARQAVECDPEREVAWSELAASLLVQLKPEHADLDQVRCDLALARKALETLDRARPLGLGTRAVQMREQTVQTIARLEAAEAELVEASADLARRLEEQILQRCLAIYWIRRNDEARVPPEDDAFWRENDCERRVRQRDSATMVPDGDHEQGRNPAEAGP